jgi:hypothetical protein
VRALDSKPGNNAIKWCLGGRRVEQKSPIEDQHAQKRMDLTGGLGRVTRSSRNREALVDTL